MPKKCQNKLKRKKRLFNKLQFQSILTTEIVMLSKRYESTEVDRRTWLHVPSGFSGPTAVTLTK